MARRDENECTIVPFVILLEILFQLYGSRWPIWIIDLIHLVDSDSGGAFHINCRIAIMDEYYSN